MTLSPLRVIVVDDHAEWRQQLTAMIESSGTAQVIGKAANGVDACAIASALKPDVILLDIELPILNGIEAAARILPADSKARILFLTGHSTWDVVEAALGTGARGYMLKNFAGHELPHALTSISSGGRYLSPAIGGRPFNASGDRREAHCHHARIYTGDAALEADYEAFAADALASGKTVIGLMAPGRIDVVRQRLKARGIDIDRAIATDRYIELDVDVALPAMMTDGVPDESRMWAIVIPLMARAARAARTSRPALAGFGDGAQTLWNNGQPSAAIVLEQFWNEMAKTIDVDMLCGYTVHGFDAGDEPMRELIRSAHTETHRP